MGVLIGAARCDEYGNIKGGRLGDQTKREVCVHDWFDDEWTHVCRAFNKKDAEKIAIAMEQACENDNIGYSQENRLSLYYQANAVKFKLNLIKSPCDCDCSSLVAVCVNSAGITVSPNIYTGNEVKALEATGKFDVYTKQELLTSSDYLIRGDILVSEYNHTAIVLTDGKKVTTKPNQTITIDHAKNFKAEMAGIYRASTDCFIRCGAGTTKTAIGVLKEGNVCRNYGYFTTCNGTTWLYVQRQQTEGFISKKCLVKI